MTNTKNTGELAIWLLVLLALANVAAWWGTAGHGMFEIVLVFIVGLALSIALAWLKKRFLTNKKNGLFKNWAIYFSLGFVSLAAWMFGYVSGSSAYSRAYNDCVANGEQVRVALADYYQIHQVYPERLSALNAKLPCEIDLRPSFLPTSMLSYKRTAQGYSLYFGDAFVSHEASQAKPFEAHK